MERVHAPLRVGAVIGEGDPGAAVGTNQFDLVAALRAQELRHRHEAKGAFAPWIGRRVVAQLSRTPRHSAIIRRQQGHPAIARWGHQRPALFRR